MRFTVICDFDGTIVDIDTAEYLLDVFGEKDWRRIDRELEKGEIDFEESLVEEFAMLKVPKKLMIDALGPVTHFRPNFEKVVEYCVENRFPLIVATGGLEFAVRHFLDRDDWLHNIRIHGPKAECTGDGVKLTFPELIAQGSENFKDDIVKQEKTMGNRVAYVGNGFADYPSVKIADLAFAIKDSRLAKLCRVNGVRCREMTDFQEVVDSIRGYISARDSV